MLVVGKGHEWGPGVLVTCCITVKIHPLHTYGNTMNILFCKYVTPQSKLENMPQKQTLSEVLPVTLSGTMGLGRGSRGDAAKGWSPGRHGEGGSRTSRGVSTRRAEATPLPPSGKLRP